MDSLAELLDWEARMWARTCRQFERTGDTPAGWHVRLADGEFGFLDVRQPATAEEHARLVQEARGYMHRMQACACLFVAERELADGRPVLVVQSEVQPPGGARQRAVRLHRITTGPAGRRVDADPLGADVPAADRDLLQHGPFPDLLPPSRSG